MELSTWVLIRNIYSEHFISKRWQHSGADRFLQGWEVRALGNGHVYLTSNILHLCTFEEIFEGLAVKENIIFQTPKEACQPARLKPARPVPSIKCTVGHKTTKGHKIWDRISIEKYLKRNSRYPSVLYQTSNNWSRWNLPLFSSCTRWNPQLKRFSSLKSYIFAKVRTTSAGFNKKNTYLQRMSFKYF